LRWGSTRGRRVRSGPAALAQARLDVRLISRACRERNFPNRLGSPRFTRIRRVVAPETLRRWSIIDDDDRPRRGDVYPSDHPRRLYHCTRSSDSNVPYGSFGCASAVGRPWRLRADRSGARVAGSVDDAGDDKRMTLFSYAGKSVS
jgi:hypothetical protein